ncbi:MAG: hypothetical protein ACI9WU_005014, partial [Myxococcota bacterium]
AAHIRDTPHDGPSYGVTFTMRDLIRSALVLDDLSPVWTTSLVADLYRALDDQSFLAAFGQRRNRAQAFVRGYLNRRMNCMSCHNTEWSITGNPDPALDRTWELPGFTEKALFGKSEGRDHIDLTPFFRRRGVVAGYYYAKEGILDELCPMGMCADDRPLLPEDEADMFLPWSWDEACGFYYPPEAVRPDDAEDVQGFFIQEHSNSASIWDLNTALRSGFEALRKGGMPIASDQSVDPETAFAWLVSVNIADRVWNEAFGARLTISNYFPRNQWQRDTLEQLADTFVTSGYSLTSLLLATTMHPYFNGAAPVTGEDPEPYAPVFDPFVDDSIPVAERRNHMGHTVRRSTSRVLLNSAYRAMGWPATPEFLIYFMSPEARLQRNVGVFHKTGDPGFDGVSFQSALSWEALVAICDDKADAPQCPLQPIFDLPEGQISGNTICELCGNQDYVCEWDARCCDVDWDAVCVEECGAAEKVFINIFPKLEEPSGNDWISQLTVDAMAAGATVGDAVRTLKDRLVTDPTLSAEGEASALEDLLDMSLSEPMTPQAETALRRACGALMASPQFLLTGYPGPDRLSESPPVTVDGQDFQAVCSRLSADMLDGLAECTTTTLTVQSAP